MATCARRGLISVLLILTACAPVAQSVPAATPVPTATPTPTASPSPTASPAPTPAPPKPVEVVAVTHLGGSVHVRIHNPNKGLGLVRAGFNLALLDAKGGIVTVWGQGGLPGSLFATVYQLPPEGDYAFDAIVSPTGPKVTAAEFTPTDPWIDWSTITPAIATTSNVQVTDNGSGYVSVTGRVVIDEPGPLNVWIAAYLRAGGGPIAAIDTVECITDGAPRAFQLQLSTETSGPYTVEKVVAYPTTVKGAGDQFTPSC